MCVRVASRSKPGRFYDVDPEQERCQCVAWNFRSDCWHIGEARRMTEPKENIHTAILTVMDDVGYVKKRQSQNLNYSFAGERELIAALRPSMVENGIYAHVVGIRDVTHETYQTTKGSSMNRVTLIVAVRFTHAPSGTFIDVEAPGEGADSGDKATPKATTGGYKYALRQTFCIETGDDPDKHSSHEQERANHFAEARNKVENRVEAAVNGAAQHTDNGEIGTWESLQKLIGPSGLMRADVVDYVGGGWGRLAVDEWFREAKVSAEQVVERALEGKKAKVK